MRGRTWSALLLVGLLAVAGCGGGDDDDSGDQAEERGAGGPVEIEFWHGQTQGVADLLGEMIDDFNASHPNIKVSKDAGGVNSDRMLQKVTAGLQADNVPDVAYIYGSDLANLARTDKLLTLDDAAKDGRLEWDAFFPAAQEAATVDGKIRAVPALIDNLAVVYNKKIFKAAGVPEPKAGWSWEDFREDRRGAQRRRQGDRGLGMAGHRRRGHHVALLAAAVAARRRHPRRGRQERRVRHPRGGARRWRRSARWRSTTSRSTSTTAPAASACSSCSPAGRWR